MTKTKTNKTLKVGILGCGAIGSRMAQSFQNELKNYYELTGLFDINDFKVQELEEKLGSKKIAKKSFKDLLKSSDLIIEGISAKNTSQIIREILKAKKHVLVMSVGQLLNATDLFQLAEKNHCYLLIPSGAIAGLDAMKAAALVGVYQINLTTRKPVTAFENNPYLKEKKIDLGVIRKETLIFEGDVDTAVKHFPQSINVAATLAMAAKGREIISVKILTSPKFQGNSHEVEIVGEFGRMLTRTDNVPCLDNPKTSYLAVLSAIKILKQLGAYVKIGT